MAQAGKAKLNILTLAFLLVQAGLYAIILTSSGALLVAAEYTAVVLCFLFALLHIKKRCSAPDCGVGLYGCCRLFSCCCRAPTKALGNDSLSHYPNPLCHKAYGQKQG